ncbi:LptM family lipoprotein [Enterococcus faecium]|uniref:LptM family lipoprotein n=1 Tax=Enterococcus faecium TaxID=1352 RepID=UPI002413FEEC|nr:hypothetical protein [Enterococcus faecium]MDG4589192.1 hypothetical protein [Enterococcus faecium]
MDRKIKYIALVILGVGLTGCGMKDDPQEKPKATQPVINFSTDNKETSSNEVSNRNGMEISTVDNVTVESLIEQLKKDNIVNGEPKELTGAVPGASSVTQIGQAVIVEYSTDKVEEYLKAEETKKITFQGKEYDVVSTNGQFMLILLDEGDKTKANESFSKNANDDRLIEY